jgi:hypothetical protein
MMLVKAVRPSCHMRLKFYPYTFVAHTGRRYCLKKYHGSLSFYFLWNVGFFVFWASGFSLFQVSKEIIGVAEELADNVFKVYGNSKFPPPPKYW